MRDHSTQSAPPRPSGTPLEDVRYTQIANQLHDLVESPREFQYAALLISYRWYPTSPIIPSVKTLAKKLKCSVRTVRRLAATFESRGWLRRVERIAPDKRQMSNDHVLCGELLALVTAVEARSDRDAGQEWQGRRSNMAGKKDDRNNTNRRTHQNGRSTPPRCDLCGTPKGGPHLKAECFMRS